MVNKINTPFSILDIARISEGQNPRDAYLFSLKQAQYAESLGYHRYWVAEHHCIKTQASSTPGVLIGYLAANTKKIRVGAGGMMLPNHTTLAVAEQFGALESFYPGRIDLGLGRSPGGKKEVGLALRRNIEYDLSQFPVDVKEILSWFDAAEFPNNDVFPIPGFGMKIPTWLLGTSLSGAELAAILGLPFAFAVHSTTIDFKEALNLYRSKFIPSNRLAKPYAMITLNIVTADETKTAISLFEQYVRVCFGKIGDFQSYSSEPDWRPCEKFDIPNSMSNSVIGNKKKVYKEISDLLSGTDIDEIMINAAVVDFEAQLHSLKLTMELLNGIHD